MRRVPRLARLIEAALWSTGLLALAYCVFFTGSAAWEQARGERRLTALIADPPRIPVPLHEGGLVGRLRLPRLDWSAVVFEGTEESVLRKGVGHLPGSAFPPDSGNVVMAGHRDTFFRRLKDVRLGDIVRLETPTGDYAYRVRTSQVVSPDAVEVLEPTPSPTLTLITCYPFYFLGSAPDRYVVRAERIADVTAGSF